MVGKNLGYWVGGKSWGVQHPLTRVPEKEQGIAKESIECYSSRGVVQGLMDGRQVDSQRHHIFGMGANHRSVKQKHPLGHY